MRRFAYRLALHLGCPNVDEMLRSMTAQQFQEWYVFSQLEVLPIDRLNYLFAGVQQILMNAHRKKGSKAVTMDKALTLFGDMSAVTPKRTDWRAMKSIAQGLTDESKKGATRGIRNR